jgi:hypothetical protein
MQEGSVGFPKSEQPRSIICRGPGDRGRVCEGWFTVEAGVVTMTDPEGIPICDVEGDKIEHKLAEGENARTIASRLTLKIFNATGRSGRLQPARS